MSKKVEQYMRTLFAVVTLFIMISNVDIALSDDSVGITGTISVDSIEAVNKATGTNPDAQKIYSDSNETSPERETESTNTIVAKRGDLGEHIKEIQEYLIELGYLNGVADGDYGPNTENAVVAFQSSHNLETTGIVDELTFSSLQNEPPTKQENTEIETETNTGSEILFRGIPWGSSINDIMSIAPDILKVQISAFGDPYNAFDIHLMNINVSDVLYQGHFQVFNNRISEPSKLQRVGIDIEVYQTKGLNLAGYDIDDIHLYFAKTVSNDISLDSASSPDFDSCRLFAATYNLSPYDYSATIEDLTKKLDSIYGNYDDQQEVRDYLNKGKKDQRLSHIYFYRHWTGENNTQLSLFGNEQFSTLDTLLFEKIHPDTMISEDTPTKQTISISYVCGDGDAWMQEASDYVIMRDALNNVSELQSEEEANKIDTDDTSGL